MTQPHRPEEPSVAAWEQELDALDASDDIRARALAARMREVMGELAVRFPTTLAPPAVLLEGVPLSASYTWDTVRHLAELYIWADGRLEWFWSDRMTDASDGSSGATTALSDRFLAYLDELLRQA